MEKGRILALVFTDLVNSTALKSERGDEAALELIGRHRAHVERLSAESGGRVIDWAGDGCFLTFEVPSSAVVFALRIQEAHLVETDLPGVRIGIHMGEVTESAGSGGITQVGGLAVDLAARIGGLASPGQILLSSTVFDTVRQRVRGENFDRAIEWRAHGPYELKGIDGAVGICEAGFEGISPLSPPGGGEKAHRAVTPAEEETLGWRPAVGLQVPRRDHWRLEQALGEGGYGEVWLAVHEKTGAKRVFKFCFEADRVRGLKREVVLFRLLKEALGHRDDIAQIVDWDFDHPPFFLESEYTEGGDLVVWAQRKGGLAKVPLATRLELVAQAAVALGAAHSVGVLHKDIKPANILISEVSGREAPRTSLSDFGIGLIMDPGALAVRGITAAGLTHTLIHSSTPSSGAGTRMYMAPELIEGKSATTHSDIYALGVLLYQMVVGEFGRSLAPGWERNVADPLLVEDISACVDGTPDQRLPGAMELATRLRSLEARRAARDEEVRKELALERARRRRRQFAVASAVGISLTVIAGAFAVRENQRAGGEKRARIEAEAARAALQIAKDEADAARSAAEHGKYLSDLDLIEQALSNRYFPEAQDRLEKTLPGLRGWEWGYFAGEAFPEETGTASTETGSAPGRFRNVVERWMGSTPRLAATLEGLTVSISRVCFSPDGSIIAARSRAGELFIWDGTSLALKQRMLIDANTGGGELAFDPSGQFLAATVRQEVWIYDMATLRRIKALTFADEELYGLLAFSPDGTYLLAQDAGGKVSAWDWRNERKAWSRVIARLYDDDWVGRAAVGFLPGTGSFVFPEEGLTMAIASLETGEVATRIEMHVPDGFQPVEMSTEQGRIAYHHPGENRYLFVGFPSGQPLAGAWSDPSGAPYGSIESSADGTLITIRNRSNTVRLLGAEGAEPYTPGSLPVIEGVSTSRGYNDRASPSPDGGLMVIPDWEQGVRVFKPGRNTEISRRDEFEHPDSILMARFLGTDDSLVTTGFDGKIRVWDLLSGTMLREIQAHDAPIALIAPSPDSRRALTLAFNQTSGVWDLNTGQRESTWAVGPAADYVGGARGPLVRISAGALSDDYFSPDGASLALPTDDRRAMLLDAKTFEQRHLLGEHPGYVHRMVFSPDSALVLSMAYPEPGFRLWDVRTGELRLKIEPGVGLVGTDFSPDSRRVAVGLIDGRLTVWDTTDGGKLLDWAAHANTVLTVQFDPSGTRIASAATDQTIGIWNAGTGELIGRGKGHEGFAIGAWFSPDGERVMSIAYDRTVRIWDLQGNELAKIAVDGNIMNAHWSPTGRRIVVTTVEGKFYVYDSIPAAELKAATPGSSLGEQIDAWRSGRR